MWRTFSQKRNQKSLNILKFRDKGMKEGHKKTANRKDMADAWYRAMSDDVEKVVVELAEAGEESWHFFLLNPVFS